MINFLLQLREYNNSYTAAQWFMLILRGHNYYYLYNCYTPWPTIIILACAHWPIPPLSPLHTQTQLCQYHAIYVLRIPGAVSDSIPYFSGLIVSFIHDVITTISPALGHALITSLSVPNSSAHMANNESLQLIYIECINDCLELVSKTNSRESSLEPDYDSQYESDHPTSGVGKTKKGCEKILSLIYSLLSFLDPTHEMVKLTRKIETIFHTLLRKTYVISEDLKVSFETGQIYACLLGKSTPFLINKLHEVEEYLRMHPETDDASTLSLQEAKKPSLTTQESVHEWRQRFYESLYDHRHLLETTLESGLQLVLTGQLSEVAALMNKREWLPLRPIMLLLSWDKYPAAGSGRELLDVLWPVEVRSAHSMKSVLCMHDMHNTAHAQ